MANERSYKGRSIPSCRSLPSGRVTSRSWLGRTAASTGAAQAQAESAFDLKKRMLQQTRSEKNGTAVNRTNARRQTARTAPFDGRQNSCCSQFWRDQAPVEGRLYKGGRPLRATWAAWLLSAWLRSPVTPQLRMNAV